MSAQMPDWYPLLRGARELGVSPFSLDRRAWRARHHPVWLYWATLAESAEPPKLVRVAGLN